MGIMAFCGTWNKSKSENGLAFFTAFEVPADQLKRAAAAKLKTEISMSGNSVTIKKTYTEDDGNVKVDENTATLGTECELPGREETNSRPPPHWRATSSP